MRKNLGKEDRAIQYGLRALSAILSDLAQDPEELNQAIGYRVLADKTGAEWIGLDVKFWSRVDDEGRAMPIIDIAITDGDKPDKQLRYRARYRFALNANRLQRIR